MTTLADIAKLAGVSPAVVSRIVNNDASLRISDETRDRVRRILAECDYVPNLAARSLRSSKSGVVAMVVHDISNPVYAEIFKGAQQGAINHGKALVLSDASVSANSVASLATMINGGGVEGLVIQGSGANVDEVIARAARRKMPIVSLQASLARDIHLLRLPDTEAAELATRHLWTLGHRRIGCLATGRGLAFTEARIEGWRAVTGDCSMLEHTLPNVPQSEEAAARLMSTHSEMTALVCFNAVSAVGALRAAAAMGVDVPGRLSIIAIHDIELAGDLRVPLTTVKMPLFELGLHATEMVIAEKAVSAGLTIVEGRPELVERASTRPLGVTAPDNAPSSAHVGG